ncbi:MAG: beta-eliminating lyase-related protein, partial [Gammaproteobacteria bacterium]
SVLCGSADFVRRARRNRKMLGGGMRQVGVLAACGLYALANNVDRLAEDHANARTLAERLAGVDGISVNLDKVHTNMVFLEFERIGQGRLTDHMKSRGILVSNPSPALRVVTHLDFDAQDIDKVVDGFASWLS